MTKAQADNLLDAFLAAKAAGQEELWRDTHPEAPDGPTVLIVWLMSDKTVIRPRKLGAALGAVDTRCGLRMAIYAAIVAHPKLVEYYGPRAVIRSAAPLGAIRAAIACYHDPTEENRRAAYGASCNAWKAARRAGRLADADAATVAADAAADVAFVASQGEPWNNVRAIVKSSAAIGDAAIVVDAIIAAIADHYEGRPLEML